MLGKLCYTTVQTAANYVGAYEAGVVSANDYYPFGLAMGNRSHNSPEYDFGFNGKRKDDQGEWGENTHYDYGFRIYNPAIARFLSVDPLAPSYPFYTPYQFAGNKPIFAIDLDGLEERGMSTWSDPGIVAGQRELGTTNAEIRQHYVKPMATAGAIFAVPLAGVAAVHSAPGAYLFFMTSPEAAVTVGGLIWGLGTDQNMPGFADEFTRAGRHIITATIEESAGLAAKEISPLIVPLQGRSFVDIDPETGKTLTGSMQSRLGKVLEGLGIDNAAALDLELHHIIPRGTGSHPVVKSATRAGFDIESLANGIPLTKYSKTRGLPDGVHASHPEYNKYIRNRLEQIGTQNLDDAGNLEALINLRSEVTNLIEDVINNARPGKDNRLNEYFRNLNKEQGFN